MAKSFKEIGKKAEALIEQGKEADQKVQSCQARVVSSNNRVAAARRQLAAASETDEEGNPVGDVESARVQLSMAQNQLAASQRALSSARGDVDRVRQQKNAHVQEIEKHNQVERSNLEKLRRLRSGAFGADSAALTEGMAQRLNEAENARVALLRSMGIDATPDHVAVGSEGGNDSGWRGGGFATLDTAGQVQSYQGGGSEGLASGGGIATPVGGGLGRVGDPLISVEDAQQDGSLRSDGFEALDDDNLLHPQNVDAYGGIVGEESVQLSDIDAAYASAIDGDSTTSSHWNGRPRTPNEVLADMKKAIRENWMNNFNADEWKRILPEKMYNERLELYRKGVAVVVGDEIAGELTVEELEQLSRIQNRAYREGRPLNEHELAELYRNRGNYENRMSMPQNGDLHEQQETTAVDFKAVRVEGLINHIPTNRKNAMELAFREAPNEIVSELNKYANILQPIVDSGYGRNEYGVPVKNGSFYSPDLRQVKMNEAMDDDEYQEELPHELSHFLDHQRGWDSSKPEFVTALESDLKRLDRNTPEGRAFFNEMLDDAVSTGAADDRAISDLIFGAFGENGNDPEIIRRFKKEGIARFTHPDDYWMGIDNLGNRSPDGGASMRRAEIYAEIGAIRCLNDRISNNFLERYFPGIYNQYNRFYDIERRRQG